MMSGRDKRALAIAGMAVGLFAALEFGALPVWDRVQAERDGLAVREQTFLKFREAVESREEREAEKELLEARLREAEEGLLPGETPAIASAELRERVQQLATESGMEVVSTQFQPTRPLGEDYLQVPLGVRLRGRIEGLVSFLEGCETGATTLSVLRLAVQGLNDEQKSLNVTLTVSGVLPRTRGEGDGTGRAP